MTNSTQYEEVDVPVNLNGLIKVRVPSNMHRADVERLAIERFNARLSQPFHAGENADTRVHFEGEAWGDSGMAKVGSLEFEVRHDAKSGVSGAMVGMAPQAGTFGADSLRANITAYVSREVVFVTARNPHTDEEKIIAAVQIAEGDVTAFLMDPNKAGDLDVQTSDLYVRFPGYCARMN